MEKRAIVIGSGMGGLAAAQVLSKHFDRVTVIEKDDPHDILGLSSVEVARLQSKGRPGVHQVIGCLPLLLQPSQSLGHCR